MRHRVLTGVFSILAVVLLVAGCATKPAPSPALSPAPAAPAVPKPKGELPPTLVMSSTATGASYIYTTALGNLLNRHTPIKASSTIHTGAEQKFQAMMTGEADITPLGAMVPVMIMQGQQGPELQKKIRLRNLCAGGGQSLSIVGIFTLPNKGIKSIKDLKGKKWCGEQKPSPQFTLVSDAVLKLHGMTRDDVKWLSIASPPDAFKDLKEGRIDAYTGVMGAGTTEMAQTTGIYVIPFTAEEQAAVNKANSAYVAGVVPKGTMGAPVDTPLVVAPSVWWVTERMSELTAYTILKTIYDNAAEFGASHPSCTGFTPENALSVWAIPYHSGAIYYFREKGLWTAQEDKKQQDVLKMEKELTGW